MCTGRSLSKLILIGFALSDLCAASEPSHAYALRRLKAATSYLKGNSFVITDYRTVTIRDAKSGSGVVILRESTGLGKVRALILHDPFFEKSRQARANMDQASDANDARGE